MLDLVGTAEATNVPFGEAISLLLYLVVPGFLARQLYRARYPAKRLSQFEGVVWSIIHSLIILLGLTGIAWTSTCCIERGAVAPHNSSRSYRHCVGV